MMKHHNLFSYIFIFLIFTVINFGYLYPGFIAGTLVKTPGGYTPIERLKKGDWVYSITKSGNAYLSKVKNKTNYFLHHGIGIVLKDDVIITAPSQKFYISDTYSWKKSKKLTCQHTLLSGTKALADIQKIVFLDQEIEFFDIHLEDVHTFCISSHDIVVHNFPLFFIGFSIAWGGGISFEGLYFGICIAGWWLGTKLLKNSSDSHHKKLDVQPFISYGAPDPDPEDDWFEKLKKTSKRRAFHYQFKKFYQDPKTKLWWSKDNGSNHAGPHYKVFTEKATRLEWIKDVDLLGNIMEKHKGPIGRSIPLKELIFY